MNQPNPWFCETKRGKKTITEMIVDAPIPVGNEDGARRSGIESEAVCNRIANGGRCINTTYGAIDIDLLGPA